MWGLFLFCCCLCDEISLNGYADVAHVYLRLSFCMCSIMWYLVFVYFGGSILIPFCFAYVFSLSAEEDGYCFICVSLWPECYADLRHTIPHVHKHTHTRSLGVMYSIVSMRFATSQRVPVIFCTQVPTPSSCYFVAFDVQRLLQKREKKTCSFSMMCAMHVIYCSYCH